MATRWFLSSSGRVFQINNVEKITFGSPLIAQGTYRDSPPVISGGAAVVEAGSSADPQSTSVAGGTTQTVTDQTTYFDIVAPSSVVEDDAFTHLAPRYLFSPFPMVFFETTDAISTNPTGTSFSTEPPDVPPTTGGHFEVFDGDCCFPWNEDCGIFNVAPPGWSVGQSS